MILPKEKLPKFLEVESHRPGEGVAVLASKQLDVYSNSGFIYKSNIQQGHYPFSK
jgi:hypothetical protein